MRNIIVIYIRWKLTGRIEVYSTLGKLYKRYDNTILGVSRHTLYKVELFDGYQNDIVEISKVYIL